MSRFFFELTVVGVMATIAFGIVFGAAWAVGSHFGFGSGQAALFAGIVLCFWFPAFANVHIAFGGLGGGKPWERISAGVRAFGMLTCSAVLTASLVATGFSITLGVSLFVFGSLCWWGSFIFDQIYA